MNDTEQDSTTLAVSRYWDLSSGWQRAINLRWSLDHFTQGNVTNTTMLLYPGVMISRTRSRGGLMPVWGDSQRYSIDYSIPHGALTSTSPSFRRKTSGSVRCTTAIAL